MSKSAARRRAFSLVELAMSMSVAVILMGGIGSALVISARAIDDGTSPAAGTSTAADVLQQITADLSVALRFTEREPEAVTFTVPDRSGDGLPETIRYAWSGTEGDPVTREYNGADPVEIATDVHHFDLTYLLRTSGPPPAPPEIESEEMLLIFHDDPGDPGTGTFKVKDKAWCAQYFFPTLPRNAVSWTITRVKFLGAMSGTADGNNSVEIRTANPGLIPSDEVLEAVVVAEEAFPGTPGWVEIPFSTLAGLDPTAGVCLLIRGKSGNKFTSNISYELDGTPATPNAHFIVTADGGTVWSVPDDMKDMRFYVYGTVTTEGTAEWP